MKILPILIMLSAVSVDTVRHELSTQEVYIAGKDTIRVSQDARGATLLQIKGIVQPYVYGNSNVKVVYDDFIYIRHLCLRGNHVSYAIIPDPKSAPAVEVLGYGDYEVTTSIDPSARAIKVGPGKTSIYKYLTTGRYLVVAMGTCVDSVRIINKYKRIVGKNKKTHRNFIVSTFWVDKKQPHEIRIYNNNKGSCFANVYVFPIEKIPVLARKRDIDNCIYYRYKRLWLR